jgi:hypothetical protein
MKTAGLTCLVFILVSLQSAFAQVGADRLATMDAMVAQLKHQEANLGPHRKFVSSALRNTFGIADRWGDLRPLLENAIAAQSSLSPAEVAMAFLTGNESLITVVAFDQLTPASHLGGFTRSETSTAWCGANAMIGFNDTGSYIASAGQSIEGYSISASADTSPTTFTYMGAPALAPNMFMEGDPVVACNGATFYYASLFYDSVTASSGVALQRTDPTCGGSNTLCTPTVAIQKSSSTHTIDKDWMTVDPKNPKNIYVTYTDFDSSGTICVNPKKRGSVIFRTAVELVSSSDGGKSWNAPVVLAQVCGNIPFVQGSQVAVGPSGKVYAAWEQSSLSSSAVRSIYASTSPNLSAATLVSSVNDVGDGGSFGLQGAIRDFELPSLAVDTVTGDAFVAWNDGGTPVPDALSAAGYGFADILLKASSDGSSWSSNAVQVNDADNSSYPTDQFQPALAVEHPSGKQIVGICYYDRNIGLTPANFLIQRTCKSSINGGSWSNASFTSPVWASVSNQDGVLFPNNYMGDYDTLAVDLSGGATGFLGAFGDNSAGNPNVSAVQF